MELFNLPSSPVRVYVPFSRPILGLFNVLDSIFPSQPPWNYSTYQAAQSASSFLLPPHPGIIQRIRFNFPLPPTLELFNLPSCPVSVNFPSPTPPWDYKIQFSPPTHSGIIQSTKLPSQRQFSFYHPTLGLFNVSRSPVRFNFFPSHPPWNYSTYQAIQAESVFPSLTPSWDYSINVLSCPVKVNFPLPPTLELFNLPSCPVSVNFPSPPIRVASTNMISPPIAVQAKPARKHEMHMERKTNNIGKTKTKVLYLANYNSFNSFTKKSVQFHLTE